VAKTVRVIMPVKDEEDISLYLKINNSKFSVEEF